MIKTIRADGISEHEALRNISGRSGEMISRVDIEDAVDAIIKDVRLRGDMALAEYGQRFDGFVPDRMLLDRNDLKTAYDRADEGLKLALLHAAENIRRYHEHQIPEGYEVSADFGSVLGQTVRGLDTVGIYVPGGTAAYPSTVLMNAIPAKLAGVGNIVMTTPPRRSDSGQDLCADINVLTAAFISGVDMVILAGGAQAIAALAYGTDTVPKADKIVGPGNAYVAEAKRRLYGLVDIDMVAGPSEILVIADEGAAPAFVAADMLSQAEHDRMSASILLTDSEKLALAVQSELEAQLAGLDRCDIARDAIEDNGLIIICRSEDEMIALANEAAPEHLEILTDDPLRLVPEIRNAGSVFCGEWSPEPLGDYFSGTNHVLPTSGTARWASPLGVYDFIKRTSYTSYSKEALRTAAADIESIGKAEGFSAHVASVKIRFDKMS